LAVISKIITKNLSLDFIIYEASVHRTDNILKNSIGGVIGSNKRGNHIQINALRDINLNITKGDRVGIVGHNGAGKSTLIRVLSQIHYPTSGQLTIHGNVTPLLSLRLGFSQESTGLEIIKLRGIINKYSKSKINDFIHWVSKFSELGNFINLPLRTYSSGMKLRLAFACSIYEQPEILIMDEWISAGDKEFKALAKKSLKKIINKSHILILASHSIETIKENCNRVIWLEKGMIKMDGNPKKVLDEFTKSK
jgi:lipopolysaccharide transport system ATP-binding protein